ncbi:Nn.00g074000.m01.CDS01 [Neocucurbitaria sp. VM-36]
MGSSAGKSWELIPVSKNLDTTRKRGTLPCLTMGSVSRNRDFFGQEKVLQELETCLFDKGKNIPMYSAQQRSQKHAIVRGAACIGKTSIAIEFAYAHKDDFDAVFWIRADETAKLEAADFALIAGALGLEDPAEHPSGPNPIVSRQLAMGWLTNPVKVLDDKDDILVLTEARWLLIFDNADEPETMMDYWPLGTAGSVLVTSRNPLSKTRPSIASESFDLPPMLSDDGVQLLRCLSHSTQVRY